MGRKSIDEKNSVEDEIKDVGLPKPIELHFQRSISSSQVCKGDNCQIIHGSPTSLSPTKIVRSELLQNVKLEVSLRINRTSQDRVLCIDGGGVKGIVEAVILKYIHYCLQKHHVGDGENVLKDLNKLIQRDIIKYDLEGDVLDSKMEDVEEYNALAEPHIHKIFDIVAGTSTGSIIATAISRLHWNPQQLIETSKVIAPIVFPKPSKWNLFSRLKNSVYSGLSLLSNGVNKYNVEPLNKYLEETIGHARWEDHDDNSIVTKPILGIITIREEDAQVKIFNSIEYRKSKTVTIKDAILASTAAPTYFPSHHVVDDLCDHNIGIENVQDMKSFTYVDGGLSANCPANYTMSLLQGPKFKLACLISIGCGDDTPTYLPLARIVQMAMNNEESWNSFYKSHPFEQPALYRITPSKKSGIGSYDLDDSHKVDKMEENYIKSLQDEESQRYLQEMVQSTTRLFAKSLQIVEATLKYNQDINMYVFCLVIETRYNGKRFKYTGQTPERGPPQILLFNRDNLGPLKILATLVETEDLIKLEYQGYEICGSPVLISRHVTVYKEDYIV